MLLNETRQEQKNFKISLKKSGILAMRKFIFVVMILLLPVISASLSYAQNSTRVYSGDGNITRYFKFDKPGAYKDFYVQLSDNITNVQQYYPQHLAYFRFDYRVSQIVSNSHNGSLGNSPQLCLPGGYNYGYVNQFKISARDTNVIFSHVIPSSCFEPADGLRVSTSNGTNWSNVYSNSFTMPLFMGLDIDPSTDSIMYCIYRPIGQSSYSLFQTTNKGQSWQSVFVFSSISLTDYSNCLISVSAFNHNIIFVKTSNGLARSSDFGNTFSNVNIASVDIKSFEYDKVDNTVYFTTKSPTPGIYKSTNEGLNWVQIFIKPCQTMEIDPSNNNILYAGSTDGLYRSTNKGLNWVLYNNSFTPSKNVIGVSKSTGMGDTIMVVTDKAVYKVYGAFTAFTDYNYFPLKIGNAWMYKTEDIFPPSVSYQQVKIISDTVINNIRYYKTSTVLPGYETNLITLDSLTGNVFCYSEGSSCGRYTNQVLVDSLAAKMEDTTRRCPFPLPGLVTDTSNISIFSQSVKSKNFYYSSAADESHKYAKGFGLVEKTSSEGFSVTTTLIGCVLNGIALGDTSSHASPYSAYFPLKIGNEWAYRQTATFFPDPPIVSYFKIKIIGDTTFNGVHYFKTSQPFASFSSNYVTLDSVTGNIFCYRENSTCSRYLHNDLIDSLAGKIRDTIHSCPSGVNGLGIDTNDVSILGQTVKSKYFTSPYPSFFSVAHRYAKNFGIVYAFAGENSSINTELLGCVVNGTLYGDTTTVQLHTVSGTIKFNDNNLPASDGYVKAIKLNTSNSSIITLDSTQIGPNGSYSLTHLPNDSCDIVAYPNSEKQSDFVPTYYPSTISWQLAVKVFTGNNPSNINVSVYRKNEVAGSFTISGLITPQTNNVSGIPGAVVYIIQGSYFRGYYITNSSGSYNTEHLPSGDYQILVDRLGYSGAQQNATISSSNLDNINFSLIPLFVGIHSNSNIIPDKFNLYQNYPNPFNPVTNIKFDIPKSSFVTLKIYNVLGKEVAVLLNENKSAGSYTFDFDASKISSGVYFYRLETESFTETKRMVILK